MNIGEDTMARAYAMLVSLHKNIDKMTGSTVSATFINEYHRILDKLNDIGIDIADFRIPDSEKKISGMTGGIFTERAYLLSKIDAVIGYFEIITSPEPKRIGYRRPEK